MAITSLIDNGHLINRDIANLPKNSQNEMFSLMKEILKDELIFVLEVEKRKLGMMKR